MIRNLIFVGIFFMSCNLFASGSDDELEVPKKETLRRVSGFVNFNQALRNSALCNNYDSSNPSSGLLSYENSPNKCNNSHENNDLDNEISGGLDFEKMFASCTINNNNNDVINTKNSELKIDIGYQAFLLSNTLSDASPIGVSNILTPVAQNILTPVAKEEVSAKLTTFIGIQHRGQKGKRPDDKEDGFFNKKQNTGLEGFNYQFSEGSVLVSKINKKHNKKFVKCKNVTK